MTDVLPADEQVALLGIHCRSSLSSIRSLRLAQLVFSPGMRDSSGILNEAGQDVLRSAVVFLHASFEDFLRELCRLTFLKRPPKEWGDLPFNDLERKPKLTIGDLAQFRGLSVDELILKWFGSWLDRETYNNFDEVCRLLERLKIPKEVFQKYRIHVDFITRRRHKIVHSADFTSSTEDTLSTWTEADLCKFQIASFSFRAFAFEIITALGFQYKTTDTVVDDMKAAALPMAGLAGYTASDQFPFV